MSSERIAVSLDGHTYELDRSRENLRRVKPTNDITHDAFTGPHRKLDRLYASRVTESINVQLSAL